MKKKFLVLSFIVVFTFIPVTFASHAEEPLNITKLKYHDPIKILDIFYRAVNRGELIVFDKKIEKSLLIPIQVEYIYKLDDTKPCIKIYSELKYHLAIPEHAGIKLKGISAILNDAGHIIEVRAHVIPVN